MGKHKMKKWVILISTVGALLLIIALVLVGRNIKDKQDNTLVLTKEHIIPYAYGYEGLGIAEPFMVRAKLYEDVMKIYEEHPDDERTEQYLGILDTLFELKIDKATGLSNGDMVEIEVIPDKHAFEEMGIYIEGKKFSFEIKGLEKLEDFDPFEGAELFKINYEKGSEYVIEFYGDKRQVVSREDVTYMFSQDGAAITVKIKDEVVNELTEKGFELKKTEQEYLLDDVEFLYATSFKEMPSDAYNSFRYGGDNVVELVYR